MNSKFPLRLCLILIFVHSLLNLDIQSRGLSPDEFLPVQSIQSSQQVSNLTILPTTLFTPVATAQLTDTERQMTNIAVLTTTPSVNALNVPVDTNIEVRFNTYIAEGILNSTNFVTGGSISGRINGAFSIIEGATVLFNPTIDFSPGETITVTLKSGLQSTDGGSLVTPTIWQFSVAGGPGPAAFLPGQISGESVSNDVATGDLNNDGFIDAFIANSGANQVYLNDGSGSFSDSGQSLGNAVSNGVHLGDLDGDGDLDAFVANGDANKIWLNNGNGIFTDSGQALGSTESLDVVLGDLDGDGDLDAFIANFGSNKVWLNNGAGVFTESQSMTAANSNGVALGDLDSDGDLDAFVVNSVIANEVWLNNGNGVFTKSWISTNAVTSLSVSLGDLDHDGDLDAFIANRYANEVWFNNGNASFANSGQALGAIFGAQIPRWVILTVTVIWMLLSQTGC